jgi:hypothetical protein
MGPHAMETPGTLPVDTEVMAPLGDVLYRGVVVEAENDHPLGDGMVCVKFVPPIAIEPSGVISFITCPVSDVTPGWF